MLINLAIIQTFSIYENQIVLSAMKIRTLYL